MNTRNDALFEYRHLECPQSWVNGVMTDASLFFWELVGTQTVVSKESHLESGGLFEPDTVYSVTTTERFATVDFKRSMATPDLTAVKRVENDYLAICQKLIELGSSPVDNYTSYAVPSLRLIRMVFPFGFPPKSFVTMFKAVRKHGLRVLILQWIVPLTELREEREKQEKAHAAFKTQLDTLLKTHRNLLNTSEGNQHRSQRIVSTTERRTEPRDVRAKLNELKRMREEGLISESDFTEQKTRLLSEM